jgi:DNA-binding response OmpR family regulator
MTRILVADDDQDLRAALRVALEVEGYEVEAVPNGRTCHASARETTRRHADHGPLHARARWFETLKYFRARNPGIWIVVISGWKRSRKTDHLAVARHVGADVILRKPFTPGELLDKLRYYIPQT